VVKKLRGVKEKNPWGENSRSPPCTVIKEDRRCRRQRKNLIMKGGENGSVEGALKWKNGGEDVPHQARKGNLDPFESNEREQ